MNKIMIDDKEYELEFIDRKSRSWCCGGEIITSYYKCPLCGQGLLIHVNEDTPGDRGSFLYLECDNCDPEHLYERDYMNCSSWSLKKTKR